MCSRMYYPCSIDRVNWTMCTMNKHVLHCTHLISVLLEAIGYRSESVSSRLTHAVRVKVEEKKKKNSNGSVLINRFSIKQTKEMPYSFVRSTQTEQDRVSERARGRCERRERDCLEITLSCNGGVLLRYHAIFLQNIFFSLIFLLFRNKKKSSTTATTIIMNNQYRHHA